MFHKSLFFALLIFPNVAFPTSCWNNVVLSDFAILDDNILVTFTVTDSQISAVTSDNYIDISVTREFNSNIIEDPNIQIHAASNSGLAPELSEFTKDVEWLSVLSH